MAAKDAQQWLNGSITDKNSVYEIHPLSGKVGIVTKPPTIPPTTPSGVGLSLKGELIVEGFPNLKLLNLEDARELDKLVVKDCPKLEQIKIQNSGVKKLELGPGLDNLFLLDFSFQIDPIDRPTARKVDEVDLSNVPNLKTLCCHGEQETKLKGIEKLTQFKFFSGGSYFYWEDTSKAKLPTHIFREWKRGVKEVLGITDVDLPDDWHTNLTNKLGGANLDQILSGKTLKDLIDNFSDEKDGLKKKLDQVKKELDKQKDYKEIKQERDQLKQQLAEIREELKLGKDATQEQILNKIKELKNAPPACSHTDYDDIKSERDNLQTEVENKKRKISELEDENEKAITKRILRVLVEKTNTSWDDLGLKVSSEKKQKIENAVSEVQVEEFRREIIKSEFNKLKKENNSSFSLNLVLGVLLLANLLILAWMVMQKQTRGLKLRIKPKQKEC